MNVPVMDLKAQYAAPQNEPDPSWKRAALRLYRGVIRKELI